MSAATIPTDAQAAHERLSSVGVGGSSSVDVHRESECQTHADVDGLNSHNAQHLDESHRDAGVVSPNPVNTQSTYVSQRGGGVDGLNPCGSHSSIDGHSRPAAGGPNSHDAQRSGESQSRSGVAGPDPTGPPKGEAPALLRSAVQSAPTPPGTLTGGSNAKVLAACSEGSTPSATSNRPPGATGSVVSLADPFLALSAEVLNDLEEVRKANAARLRELTRDEVDADGERRGWGLDERHRDVARLAALVGELEKSEHQAVLNLNRLVRAHPLGPWIKTTRGVGEKQAARLLASIGDPAWNNATDTWRTCRQLYTYCGYGDAEKQVRRRGERGNWDPAAKMRAHLVIASAVKVLRAPCSRPEGQAWADHRDGCACSPYRLVYDKGRRKYADAVHTGECKRCGPSGKPAQPGTPLSAGHQEARGYRLACKALLKDLWRESRRLHGIEDEEALGSPA